MGIYSIDRQFGIYRYFKPPFNNLIFKCGEKFLSKVPDKLTSDEEAEFLRQSIAGSDGEQFNLYLFMPKKTKTDKIYLYIHGGGFAFKGYESHYNLCKRFAVEGNCKVVYADYRLAFHRSYPVPLDDSYAAYKWILKNAETLGISTGKIIVGGDSAGGCLAFDVTIRAIENRLAIPKYLMLFYPVLDKRMETDSMKKFRDTPIWNAKLNKKMWDLYLGGQEYVSPNERTDFSQMPDTYIETAEFDCLHDEAIQLYSKLKNSGIRVTLNETRGTMHGFDIKECSITEQALKKRVEAIKKVE